MATLSTLNVKVTGNTAGLSQSLDKAKSRLSTFKENSTKALKGVGKAAGALGVVGGAALIGFGATAVSSFANAGDELDKMSKRTGLSVESLGELKFAAEQSGSGLEAIEKSTKKMSSVILDANNGLAGASDALSQLGLDASDLAALSPEDQFQTIANALGNLDDASQKAALAQDVFGKAGSELIPLLNEGEEGMNALRQQAVDLGGVMSGEAAASAAEFKDAQNELMTVIGGLFVEIGSALVPVLTTLVDALAPVIKDVGELAAEVMPKAVEIIEKLWPAFTALVDAVLPLIPNWPTSLSRSWGR